MVYARIVIEVLCVILITFVSAFYAGWTAHKLLGKK